jgi:two-component system, chemotaxis family, CheB/CheR fusion protein
MPNHAKTLPNQIALETRPDHRASIIGLSNNDFVIVAIGASAGGLEAASKLMDALTDQLGADHYNIAFILVQHLDPSHDSLLVELLSKHTKMVVTQAAEGNILTPNHLYVIPPGTYLSVKNHTIHLSEADVHHGARLPFDFLLRSLADDCAARCYCIVLSGTGSDGSEGAKALKAKGGFIIAQDPNEAEYNGMPNSVVQTGSVDLTLKVADMPAALTKHSLQKKHVPAPQKVDLGSENQDIFIQIIELLRTRTSHDFTLYKQGTLKRRIERRMAMGDAHDMATYLQMLQSNSTELEMLAKDLLINVTSFFRDSKVFDYLAENIIPELVRNHSVDQPLRVWIAGCSTGEETYSLAMLLREEIARSKRTVKLQIFASDLDADAVTLAREGLYPDTIVSDISAERLARFFSKEDNGYKISPELRANVVFTVQDVLLDPPFSKIDFISCRNLLIYLGSEAQAKVISLFHFALRQDGILLLGSAESAGKIVGRFKVISKPERLYRHIGRSRLGDVGFTLGGSGGVRATPKTDFVIATPSKQSALAELAKRMAIKIYAPALVLINRKMECLYFLGETDKYLHHSEGHPTNDLLGMVQREIRIKLRVAIQQTTKLHPYIKVDGALVGSINKQHAYDIEVHLVAHDNEELLLVGFFESTGKSQLVDIMSDKNAEALSISAVDNSLRVVQLEQELETIRTELHAAIHNLELSSEEQKAVNEEALSVNEEFQSTNEELLTSKEELQSLNEELTALNNQLQETLDRQRITSNDLQNVLYSTDVATLFLDPQLNIRFFTPATKALFNVIPTDIGRPLADLHSLAMDQALEADAQLVLKTLHPVDREIETRSDIWFTRRILPYKNHDNKVEGVVITFTDISERKRIRKALEAARAAAEKANLAKSRFLAAASHDLRQPLQTIAFVTGLLGKYVEGEKAESLLKRLDDTLHSMTGMLNTLLDINQIEAGVVRADIVPYPLNDLLDRLREEFSYHAQAKAITLKVVSCKHLIHTDPRLLEQIIRNLLANAIKYTRSGKVLLGCRKRAGFLSIEIWDTGIGIPDTELQAIFEEYHQLDNKARERNRGLGLGLAIVQRLVALLGYKVHVRSKLGKGSVFAIEIALPVDDVEVKTQTAPHLVDTEIASLTNTKNTSILVVEDDPDVRELLAILLEAEGYSVTIAFDGVEALELMKKGTLKPGLVIADYNLPKGMDGLQLAAQLRVFSGALMPVIILTGDISTHTISEIVRADCVHLNKPVKLKKMMSIIDTLLSAPTNKVSIIAPSPQIKLNNSSHKTVYIVDDDLNICDIVYAFLNDNGYSPFTFSTCEAFLAAYQPKNGGCLLIDAYLPGMNGFALLQHLKDAGNLLPAIMITGHSDVSMAVQAMKAGAIDFIEKPVNTTDLLSSIERAFEQSLDANKILLHKKEAQAQIEKLTTRQKQIMTLVLAGHPSKNIAADLDISQRTVENHRNAIMTRTGCKSLPALARLALAAAPAEGE